MKTNNDQKAKQQQRRKLLLMPLIIIPMVTLLFNVLGGGSAQSEAVATKITASISDFPMSNAEDLKANKAATYQAMEDEKNYLANDFKEYSLQNAAEQNISVKKDTNKIPGAALQKADQAYFDFYKDSNLMKQANAINYPMAATNKNQAPAKGYQQEDVVRTRQNFNDEDEEQKNRRNNIDGQASGKLLQAIIHGTQKVRSNTRVSIRMMEAYEFEDIMLEKNDLIYGIATAGYSGRLSIKIKSLSIGDRVVPVNWTIYDLDGNEGIHVPFQLVDNNYVKNQTVNEGSSELQNAVDQTVTQAVPVPGINIGTRLLGNLARNNRSVKKNNFTVVLDSGNRVLINVENEE
jgi:hypothetical protein